LPYGALFRALELFDLMIADPRWKNSGRLKEIARAREVLCDTFLGNNTYRTSLDSLSRYFYYFTFAARAKPSASNARKPESGPVRH